MTVIGATRETSGNLDSSKGRSGYGACDVRVVAAEDMPLLLVGGGLVVLQRFRRIAGRIGWAVFSICFIICVFADDVLCFPGIQKHFIRRSTTSVRCDVGGNVDESAFLWPNVPSSKRFVSSIMVRNLGDKVVVNPRVSVNGRQVPLTTAELLGSITYDSKDPLDRLLRLYYAIARYSIHQDLFLGALQQSPLTSFVAYGGGMCDDRANIQCMLWDVLGHRWRDSKARNHTVREVEYGRRMLHLDTDLQSYYLMHDNRTIASSQDLRDDPMLVLRAAHYRNYERFPRGANEPEIDMWYSSEKVAALYGKDKLAPPSSNKPVNEKFEIRLRPGEGYGWHSGKPKHFHPVFSESCLPDALRDFLWETKLDFSKPSHRWAVRNTDGSMSAVRGKTASLDGKTKIALHYGHPFPMTDANLRLDPAEPVSRDSLIALKVKAGNGKPARFVIPVEKLSSGYSLNAYILKMDFPIHELQIEISVPDSGKSRNRPVLLKGLSFELYSQATDFAFPSLKAGRNRLTYSDASDQRSVELQIDAIPLNLVLPRFIQKSSFEPNNATVSENDLAFSWPACEGSDAMGYQFQISAFADMRYPLSPTFERIVSKKDIAASSEDIRFRLPWRGMLPVNRDLYWRVRPIGKDSVAGVWSKVFSFRVRGPETPEKVRIDYGDGKVILSWSASHAGTRPVSYEIHSSRLKGFMPMSEPHRLLGFSERPEVKYRWHDMTATDWPVVPGTTMATTQATHFVLYDENCKGAAKPEKLPGAHFRVIAVDAKGSRSCPSKQAHLKSPMILMPGSFGLKAGDVTLQVQTLSSLGRITTKSPYFLGLWNKPELKFSLALPAGLAGKWRIDENIGILRGHLDDKEEVAFRVIVEDQHHRKASKEIHIRAK